MRAVGPTSKKHSPFLGRNDAAYRLIPAPQPGDWLDEFAAEERPQSFLSWLNSKHEQPTKKRPFFCLLPLGEFAPDRAPDLHKLAAYCELFLGVQTRLLETLPVERSTGKKAIFRDAGRTLSVTRRQHEGREQWLTGDILKVALSTCLACH